MLCGMNFDWRKFELFWGRKTCPNLLQNWFFRLFEQFWDQNLINCRSDRFLPLHNSQQSHTSSWGHFYANFALSQPYFEVKFAKFRLLSRLHCCLKWLLPFSNDIRGKFWLFHNLRAFLCKFCRFEVLFKVKFAIFWLLRRLQRRSKWILPFSNDIWGKFWLFYCLRKFLCEICRFEALLKVKFAKFQLFQSSPVPF